MNRLASLLNILITLVNTGIVHKKNNDEIIPLQEILGKEISY